MAWPDNTNGLGVSSLVVSTYKGAPVYAWYYQDGNYWIAYALTVPSFVGAGGTPAEAGQQFDHYINQVVSSSS